MSAAAGPGIVLSGDVKEADLARAAFFQELLADGLRRVHVAAWATQAARPEEGAGRGGGAPGERARLALRGAPVAPLPALREPGEGRVTVRVAHRDDEGLALVLAELRAAIPESTVDERSDPGNLLGMGGDALRLRLAPARGAVVGTDPGQLQRKRPAT